MNQDAAADAETRLPSPDDVVVQLARIEPVAWEPELLADMAPHFSVQGSGFAVFRQKGGPSATDWYQSVITGTGTLDLLKLLVDDIDVPGIARRRGVPEVKFEIGPDAKPAGTGVLGVVYVRSADDEALLVVPEQEMENPKPDDPDAERLRRLHRLVMAIEIWKDGVSRGTMPEELRPYLAQAMGFWTDVQAPYTPVSATAYGTAARSGIPSDAPVARWSFADEQGIVVPIESVVKAPYGEDPTEFELEGDNLARLLQEARRRDSEALASGKSLFWGPLWREDGKPKRYLIGIAVEAPGGNHTTIDFDYVLPKRGIGLHAPVQAEQ
jgi:hypothetical protein